jgi:SAM-dependent methyltransferase
MPGKPPSDSFNEGAPYERYVGRWSRRVAPLFLRWLSIPPGRRWLDVGCGTGALAAAILDTCAPASVAGVEPSAGFLATAREKLGGRAELLAGSATAIPLDDASVDVVVSALVLNFVPDAGAAMREMKRVAKGGGTIAAYVWDYSDRMQLMHHFWETAVEIDPGAAKLRERTRFPMCRPEGLEALFAGAGLVEVDVHAIDCATPFADSGVYWEAVLGGQGPAPAYAMSLDEDRRARLRERLRGRLPVSASGSIDLMARAWAVRGRVAG